MASRIAGIAFLKVDGNQYPLRGNFDVSPSAFTRSGIAGLDQVHGYMELPRIPYIEGDVSLDPALSTENVEAITNSTVTAELANGHTYVLRQAWCTDALVLVAHDGMARVRFEGISCDELLP
jgi:hypothetical protein